MIFALSLWQPWATAMQIGLKRVETRSWAPHPSQLRPGHVFAIHAAKKRGPGTTPSVECICDLVDADVVVGEEPRGVLLGLVALTRVAKMTPALIDEQTPREFRWGNWQPGRFAWFTEPVRWFETPIPTVGRQGLFRVPDEIGGAR